MSARHADAGALVVRIGLAEAPRLPARLFAAARLFGLTVAAPTPEPRAFVEHLESVAHVAGRFANADALAVAAWAAQAAGMCREHRARYYRGRSWPPIRAEVAQGAA